MSRLVGCLVALGLVTIACAGSESAAAPDPVEILVAEGWDPLLAEHAAIVQDLRGELFTAPVEIAFIDPDLGVLSSTPARSPVLLRTDDLYRALGIATTEFDAVDERRKAWSGDVAFFDNVRRRIVLSVPDGERPAHIDPELGPILVHELTHALQAQRPTGAVTRGEEPGLARLLLLEGEAEWLLQRYVQTLAETDFDRWLTASHDRWQHRPSIEPAIEAELLIPYEVGGSFVSTRYADGGLDGVAAAFGHLGPASLLDPLAPPTEPVEIAEPDALPQADNRLVPFGSEAELSAIRVYQMLATVVPAPDALEAARAVSSHPRPVVLVDDGVLCLTATVGVIDSERGELDTAFDAWAAALPASRSVEPFDGGVSVRACDPGIEWVPPPLVDPVQAVLQLGLLLEGEAWALTAQLPSEVGTCAAWAIVESVPPLERFTVAAVEALETGGIPAACR